MRPSDRALLASVLVAGALMAGRPAVSAAQERVPVAEPTRQVTPARTTVSPGGAFLRAALIPGWGHAAIGSYTRAGFYFGMQSATVYTLLRARIRIAEAERRVAFREAAVRAQLEAEGVTDPELVTMRLEEDELLEDRQGLLGSRREQQEDLVAFGLFLLLLSGADAYVSAHLAEFPQPLALEVRPVSEGRVELGVRLMLPN